MGRKSNRKEQARQFGNRSANEDRKYRFIAYAIIFPAVGLLIWSLILKDRTLIKTVVVLLPALLGGFIGVAILTVLWRKQNAPFWLILFNGMLNGASVISFLITAPNYYFRDDITFITQLDIVEAGNHSKRKSTCRTPYAIVAYNEIEKEIKFECEYEKNISNFKKVRLELSRGFWGFDVIESKELVP